MTSSPLSYFSLSSFRGASKPFRLEFEKAKKLTLIYGENGTGKTTICDGLEFLADGRIGSLEDKGLGAQTEKYWPTVGNDGNAISITLGSVSGSCTATIQGKKVDIAPAEHRPRVAILRRNQILRIVETQPAKRYEEIKHFIDIATVEASETTLRGLVRTLEAKQERCVTALGENLKALESFHESAGKPPAASALAWAQARLAKPRQQLDASVEAIGKLRSAFKNLEDFPAQYQEALSGLDAAGVVLDSATEALNTAITQAGRGANELLDIFNAGVQFLRDHPTTTACPLCGSTEKIVGLADRIQAKLQAFATLKAANEVVTTRRKALDNQQQALNGLIERFNRQRTALVAVRAGYTWPAAVGLPPDAPPEDIGNLEAWLTRNKELSSAWKTLEEEWQGEKRFVVNLKKAVDQYTENLTAQNQLERQIPRVKKAHDAIIAERQAFTDTIIKEIADDVGALYEAIHPGEGLNKISLQLDPKRRASLDLNSEFCAQTAPPQAYFSQSHLDTLGLCVFLALALRDKPDETILVLDDVIGSIDEPHVERVIETIYEHSRKFRHCVVTTHYRPWREKFRWGWLKNGQCQFIELTGWDLSRGLRTVGSLSETERLKKLLAENQPDVQAICSKAGVILEAALDYLTQKYECSVPRRRGNAYTLGDLLPAIDKKLRPALRAEIRDARDETGATVVKTVELKPLLDEIDRIVQVRNAFGAHFKDVSFELLDTDALGFATAVTSLMDALTHPESGWPNSKKSGTHWATSDDLRRLHPLIRPS